LRRSWDGFSSDGFNEFAPTLFDQLWGGGISQCGKIRNGSV
jgi:hypothetical protein